MKNTDDAERQRLATQVLDASTLPEVEAAIKALDQWMAAHPDDQGMEEGYEQLALMKDGLLSQIGHAAESALAKAS